jgi:hypothetical protein
MGEKRKKKKKDNTSRHLSILKYPIYISCHLSIRKDLYLGCQIHVSCHLSIPKEWANFSYCILFFGPSPARLFHCTFQNSGMPKTPCQLGIPGLAEGTVLIFFFLHIFFSFFIAFYKYNTIVVTYSQFDSNIRVFYVFLSFLKNT